MSSTLSQLFANLEPFVHQYGAAAVMVILMLESLGLPLPGESILIFASVLAGRGEISLFLLGPLAWVGAVIGDNIGYLIGRSLGRGLILRYGSKIGISSERFNRVQSFFQRYGAVTVAFARFVSVLRQLNGVVAGTMGMDWKRFLLFNAIGGALWVAVWVSAGYFLGIHGSEIKTIAHNLGWIGAVVGLGLFGVALLLAIFLSRRNRQPV